jgi:TonB family protein
MLGLAVAAMPLSAQSAATPPSDLHMPGGQNLRDRPQQRSDVILTIGSDGQAFLNAVPVADDQLGSRLGALFSARQGDNVFYLRGDVGLPFRRLTAVSAVAARSGACAVAMVGEQLPGTASLVLGDAGQLDSPVRRAIDLQLPPPSMPPPVTSRVVLEVLPGPAYRINTMPVPPASLGARLLEIYNPRPVKVLFVTADSTVTLQALFHAMDVARGGGVIVMRLDPSGFTVPDRLPDIDLSMRVTARDSAGDAGRCRRDGLPLTADFPTPPRDSTVTYFDFQVSRPARLLAGSQPPQYPQVLRAAHTEGEVLMRFVVGTDGLVDQTTVQVLRSSHELFTQAVRDVLPDLRFVPASIGGQPVRQRVQMPFVFALSHLSRPSRPKPYP